MTDDTDDAVPSIEDLLHIPEHPPERVSPMDVRLLLAGAVPASRVGALRRAIAEDPVAQAEYEELLDHERGFEAEHPWEAVKDELFARAAALPELDDEGILRGFAGSSRPAAPRTRWWRVRVPVMVGAAAAVLAFALLPDGPAEPARKRVESAEELLGFARVGEHTAPLAEGTRLREGDRLQLQLSTSHDHLALLGVDGTGTVSRHYPLAGEMSGPWTPGKARIPPGGLVLDGAPGPEVFVAFVSAEPLSLDTLQQALHDAIDAGGDGSRGLLTTDWEALGIAPRVHIFHVEKRAE